MAIGGIAGFIMIVSPQFFMADEIQGYMGESWATLEAANPVLFSYFMHDIRLLGFMQVAASLVIFLIVLLYYRKLDRAAWYISLLAYTLGLLPTVVLNVPIGDAFVITLVSLLLLAGYVGLALGAPAMFATGEKVSQPRRSPV